MTPALEPTAISTDSKYQVFPGVRRYVDGETSKVSRPAIGDASARHPAPSGDAGWDESTTVVWVPTGLRVRTGIVQTLFRSPVLAVVSTAMHLSRPRYAVLPGSAPCTAGRRGPIIRVVIKDVVEPNFRA